MCADVCTSGTSCMHIKGGTWSPYGFTISETSVPEDKFGKLQAYGRQLERIGASDVSYGGAGADVGIWCQLNGTQQPGVPCGSLIVRSLPPLILILKTTKIV